MSAFRYPDVDLSNGTAVAEWYLTHHIPQRYNAAIVVASVLVAVLGSYSTLIVLGKRTSNAGARNALLLVWAAMTMSCVGIWGMHFIGMNFRLEPIPGESWYISFSPAFTVFSLIVPFVALVLAFVFVDYFTLKLWRIAVSGVLTGCIVGLMHYSASMKCNFHVSYAPAQTVISIILACFCAIIALTLFFRLRAQWQDSWQRRLLCSFILAIGVSGMHYLGSSGTSYSMRADHIHSLDQLRNGRHSNMTIVIIVAVMCFVIVVASTFMSISDELMARETRKQARKIVLASASFDHLGRLLVQADGSLPLVVLEEKTLRHTEVLSALDTRSEIFQWLFSVSWAWNIVVPFLDAIGKRVGQASEGPGGEHAHCKEGVPCSHTWHARLARKLRVDAQSRRARRDERQAHLNAAAANATSFNAGIAQSLRALSLYDFRDRVVDAAHRLADQLEVPLEDVGVFYDHILPTGTQRHVGPRASIVRRQQQLFARRSERNGGASGINSPFAGRAPYSDDEEASISTSRAPSIFADGEDGEEGVSIFLVREMPVEHQSLLAKRGYRFTETRFLASVLADRHAVGRTTMEDLLDGLRLYAKRGTRPVVQPGGVYVGLFGVRPSTSARQGGLDVLVYNFARHQIPAFRLPDIVTVTEEMRRFLRLLDQMPVEQALRVCERESTRIAERNKAIARLLLDQAHAQLMSDKMASKAGASKLRSSSNEHGGTSTTDCNDKTLATEQNLRQVLDLQTQEASLQAFQIALYTALEALMQSVRVFPRINTTARVSAEVLEVPSTLDDAKPPAHVILVQAVLPADKAPQMRSSGSTLGGLIGQGSQGGAQMGGVSGNGASSSPLLVVPGELPQAGTPFVFTPYTLFTKTQMMLLRGKTALTFSVEVQQALGRRYNIDPLTYSRAANGEKGDMSRSDADMNDLSNTDDIMSMKTSGKSMFAADDDEDEAVGTARTEIAKAFPPPYASSTKRWISHLPKFGAKPAHDLHNNDEADEGAHNALSRPSNKSISSLSSADDIMLQERSTTVRKQQATLPASRTSPSSFNGLAATPSHRGGSLGIRRFTGENSMHSALSSAADQGRFARPAAEREAAEDGMRSNASATIVGRGVLQPVTPKRRSSVSTGNDIPQQAQVYFQHAPPLHATPKPSIRPRSRTVGASNGIDVNAPRPSTAQVIMPVALRGATKSSATDELIWSRPIGGSSSPLSPPSSSVLGLPRRPHTAQAVRRPSTAPVPAGKMHGSGMAIADVGPASTIDRDSVQARLRLDNWQLRHLRDLERFQPTLLVGILPNEY